MAVTTGAQAVDRASTLLVAVLEAPDQVAFADLVAAAGLPKSTVSRMLTSLERNGLVRRGPDSAVGPGPVLTRFASSGRSDELLRIATVHLERLGELTGETVNLAVPGPREVQQIAQVDSRYRLGPVNWVGRPVPFHCSALGKVFLAHGVSSVPAGQLARLTDRTITSRERLEAELDSVRRLGYAVADSELEPGLVAVAAPITSSSGVVVAAVSISAPSVRLTPTEIPDIGVLLVEEARSISEELDASSLPRKVRTS
jgi:DNA-binding IclR family transcriptional regulator